jgi:hypothetical protein
MKALRPFIAGRVALKRRTVKSMRISNSGKDKERLAVVDSMSDLPDEFGKYYVDQIRKIIPSVMFTHRPNNRGSLLRFVSVPAHEDDWNTVKYKGKISNPVFVHVVLQGGFTFKQLGVTLQCERGDVLVHEANILHEVQTVKNKICSTFSMDTHVRAILEDLENKNAKHH